MSDNVIDFKKRSTGEVAAPDTRPVLGCPCATPCTTSTACEERQRFNVMLSGSLDLVEKLATSVERAAVVKYLRVCGFGSGSVHWRLADDIEKGEHCK